VRFLVSEVPLYAEADMRGWCGASAEGVGHWLVLGISPFSLTHSLSQRVRVCGLTLSISHSLTLALSHSHSLTLAERGYERPSHSSHPLTLPLSHCLTLSLSHSLTLSLSQSEGVRDPLTLLTLSLSLSHSVTLTLAPSLSLSGAGHIAERAGARCGHARRKLVPHPQTDIYIYI